MREARPVMAPELVRVLARADECEEVVTLTLARPSRGGPRPGQFNMLYAFGVGEVAISTCGDPARSDAVVHTIHEVGAVTRALCRLRPGDLVGVRGPFGAAWPVAEVEGRDLVLVAGGLGLAPLRPVVYEALARRASEPRVHLLVGARAPRSLLYAAELARWQRDGDLDVQVTVDHADPGWRGHVGVVTTLISRLELAAGAVAFVCGPEVMMRFTVRELVRRGIAEDRIYLAMERNMKCAVGLCGHCQLGPHFVCKDGPVLRCDRLGPWLWRREA